MSLEYPSEFSAEEKVIALRLNTAYPVLRARLRLYYWVIVILLAINPLISLISALYYMQNMGGATPTLIRTESHLNTIMFSAAAESFFKAAFSIILINVGYWLANAFLDAVDFILQRRD